jgi:protein phosphatase
MSPTIGLLDLAAGDALLLCTDGLTKHVSDDAITAVLAADHTPEQVCRTLVAAALAGGGSDNVTVVVARAR